MGNMAKAFAQSGFFGYKNSSEAFTLMCLAQANGLHPAKAAERYHIIQGRPAMKADAMLAAFQESGGNVRWVKRTEKECILHLSHPQGGELDVTWSIDRATKAGLTGKSTWKQYPTQMLSARCVSEGVRALYPACLCGMYTPEEVTDFDSKSAPQQPQPTDCEVLDYELDNEAPATQPEPTEPPKDEPAQQAENTTTTPSGDNSKAFFDAMKALAKKNYEMYLDLLGKEGFERASEIPEEKRTHVYSVLYRAINKEA
jgi:hypothetical protein